MRWRRCGSSSRRNGLSSGRGIQQREQSRDGVLSVSSSVRACPSPWRGSCGVVVLFHMGVALEEVNHRKYGVALP